MKLRLHRRGAETAERDSECLPSLRVDLSGLCASAVNFPRKREVMFLRFLSPHILDPQSPVFYPRPSALACSSASIRISASRRS